MTRKRWPVRSTIKRKQLLLFAAMFSLVGVLGVALFRQQYGVMAQNAADITSQYLEKIRYDMELSLNAADRDMPGLLNDSTVHRLLGGDEGVRGQVEERLDAALARIAGEDAFQISLLTNRQRIVASSYRPWTGLARPLGEEWQAKIAKAAGERVIISGYNVTHEGFAGQTKVLSIARAVMDQGKQLGTLMLEISMEYLSRICDGAQLGEAGFIALLDDDDYILFHTRREQIGGRFLRIADADAPGGYFVTSQYGEAMLLVESASRFSNLKMIGAIPQSELRGDLNAAQRRVTTLYLLGTAALLLVSAWISQRMTRPIISISKAMRQVEDGDFSPRIPQTRTDEIGDLQRSFNVMVERLDAHIKREYKWALREREAQITEMMATINPHFIYNTLSMIGMTAYLNQDRQVSEMLELMADVFRVLTTRGETSLPLKAEAEAVDKYLRLINLGREAPIRVQWTTDAQVLACRTMKFLLQPLVENCVVHGLRDKRRPGSIAIDILRQGPGRAGIRVADDGAGCPPDKLQALTAALERGEAPEGADRYFALLNINSRLRLRYGEAYGLAVGAGEHGGFWSYLTFPMEGAGGEAS